MAPPYNSAPSALAHQKLKDNKHPINRGSSGLSNRAFRVCGNVLQQPCDFLVPGSSSLNSLTNQVSLVLCCFLQARFLPSPLYLSIHLFSLRIIYERPVLTTQIKYRPHAPQAEEAPSSRLVRVPRVIPVGMKNLARALAAAGEFKRELLTQATAPGGNLNTGN